MSRGSQKIWIGISMIAIAASIAFIVRSSGPPAAVGRHDPAHAGISALSESAISLAEILDSDRLYTAIFDAAEGSAGIGASVRQRLELLARQTSDMVQVVAAGTADDHVALMESWGGSLILQEADRAILGSGWPAAGSPAAISRIDVHRVRVDLFSRASEHRRQPASAGQSITSYVSNFRFPTSTRMLMESDAPLAVIRIPIETIRGDTVVREYVLLWSEEARRWIPRSTLLISSQSAPAPVTFF